MSSPQRCPYAALGLPRSADAAAIKRAFVEAAKRNHPDHLPAASSRAERAEAAARFVAVAEAYSVLGDASKRAAFDRAGGASSSSARGSAGSYARSSSYGADNPYAGGFRPSSSSSSSTSRRTQQRPPSLLSNLLRLVVARSTRGDAWAHVALATAALGGAALAATAGDDLWRIANRGKLFEDVAAGADRRRQRRQEREREGEEASASAAPPSPEPAPAPPAAPEASD